MSHESQNIREDVSGIQLTMEEINKILGLEDSADTHGAKGEKEPKISAGKLASVSMYSSSSSAEVLWEEAQGTTTRDNHHKFDHQGNNTVRMVSMTNMMETQQQPQGSDCLDDWAFPLDYARCGMEIAVDKYAQQTVQLNQAFNEKSCVSNHPKQCLSESTIQFLGSDSTKQFITQRDLKHLTEFDEQTIHIENDSPSDLLCAVCKAAGMKYASYGGQVCSSCRSFFCRSVQTGYHSIYHCKQVKKCKMDKENRRKCQFCRFQCCLASGMKINWVLSDQERDRRFNKLKKVNTKIVEPCSKQKIPPVIHISFSTEEMRIMEDLHSKFKVPWLQNFLMFDKEAGVNFIEHFFGCDYLKARSWKTFKRSVSNNFLQDILPKFPELTKLSPHDIGQIKNSQASGIAEFFRSSQAFHMTEGGHVVSHVVRMSRNADLVSSLDLHDLMSRLDLSKDVSDTRMPAYEEMYPDTWVGDRQTRGIYREALDKIVNWPIDENKMFDYWMVVLMTLILVFNADFYTLVNRDSVEKIQMKYIMILQRYLRFKLKRENANKKFLQAMMLLSQTRQAWEISSATD